MHKNKSRKLQQQIASPSPRASERGTIQKESTKNRLKIPVLVNVKQSNGDLTSPKQSTALSNYVSKTPRIGDVSESKEKASVTLSSKRQEEITKQRMAKQGLLNRIGMRAQASNSIPLTTFLHGKRSNDDHH